MKKIIIALIIAAIFSSCDLYHNTLYYSRAVNHKLYSADFGNIEDYHYINAWIKNHVKYKTESYDNWSDPETTVNRGYGDCEDMALLFMNIAYFKLNVKCNLILVDCYNETDREIINQHIPQYYIVDGGYINHAIIEMDGIYIDPMFGIVKYSKIGYKYTFNEVFGE